MTRPDRHVAERTCVACREAGERDALIRLVAAPDGQVVPDLRGRLPGRGAWVHPASACLERLDDRVLSRALAGRVQADEVARAVREAVWAALLDGLSLAAAAGGLVGGHDQLELALRDGRIVELIQASDAAERTVRSIGASAGDLPVTILPLDREGLGARVGRGALAVVGVLPVPATAHLCRQLRRWRGLG